MAQFGTIIISTLDMCISANTLQTAMSVGKISPQSAVIAKPMEAEHFTLSSKQSQNTSNVIHQHLPSVKLTAKAPENGWLEYDCFLLGPELFAGANC